ncbi:MAG: adenylate/guanylate cyclase domain-containing protein [Candidatus Schekmanbacteria bacterium]|nr:adenylate/guanylate cyclase domain-containing protein [Candidatus Schekmanbacteria bacterium]
MFQYDDSTIEAKLREQVSSSISKGGVVALGFTVPTVALLAVLCVAGGRRDLQLGLAFASLGLVQSFAAYRFGKMGRATGRNGTYLLLPLVVLPLVAAIGSHFLGQPGGAAALLNAPFTFIMFHLVVLTGFALDARFSMLAGFVCAAGYLAMYLLAREQLAQISAPDPLVSRVFSDPAMHVIKAALLAVAGIVMALLSVTTRRLIFRVSREEQEKSFIRNTFGMIVDPRVRDRMIRGQIELGGEIRVNTVLFCDIRGFSTFSERMSPKELLHFMKDYFDLMNAEIRGQEGTIMEYVGDEVMALFGAPLPLPDHAERALGAACRMQQALAAQRPAWEREGKPPVRAGVGVHTGSMLVGNIGSSERYKYGAIGDNVNLASRLQGLTKEYGVSVIASDETVREAAGRFHVRELDRVRVRGREAEVGIYEVLGPIGEELPPTVQTLAAAYEQALRIYRQEAGPQAREAFARCLELDPTDRASALFLERLAVSPSASAGAQA